MAITFKSNIQNRRAGQFIGHFTTKFLLLPLSVFIFVQKGGFKSEIFFLLQTFRRVTSARRSNIYYTWDGSFCLFVVLLLYLICGIFELPDLLWNSFIWFFFLFIWNTCRNCVSIGVCIHNEWTFMRRENIDRKQKSTDLV